MSRITLSLLAIAALSLSACGETAPAAAPEAPAAEAALTNAEAKAEAKDGMTETPMDEVEAKLKTGDCHVFDANNADTRTESGIIEGAVLLDSYREYDLAALPQSKDASVVFYCGSTMCTASDKAADRAITAGYTNVSVMREGIKGWKKAGKKTVTWTAPAADKG